MKQFFKNLWSSIKNIFFSFKVLTKDQYNELVKQLILKKDELFGKFDANSDNVIQMSELINGIKTIIKKDEEKQETSKAE